MLEFYQATRIIGRDGSHQNLIEQAAKDVTGGTKTKWRIRKLSGRVRIGGA